MTQVVWAIIAVVMMNPDTNGPVFVVTEPPKMVTLEQCINEALEMQADKTVNTVVLCMPPIPKSEA